MSVDEQVREAPSDPSALPSRRSLLKLGGAAALGAGAWALAAGETSTSSPGTTASAAGENSVLDKWISTKTAELGGDPTFPPIQVKDSSGKPTGYQIELTEAVNADPRVTPQN